jgi:hypothetical protein
LEATRQRIEIVESLAARMAALQGLDDEAIDADAATPGIGPQARQRHGIQPPQQNISALRADISQPRLISLGPKRKSHGLSFELPDGILWARHQTAL